MKKLAFMITIKPECLKQTKSVAKRLKDSGYVVINVFSNLGTIIGICDKENENLKLYEVKRLSFMESTIMFGTNEVYQEWSP